MGLQPRGYFDKIFKKASLYGQNPFIVIGLHA
jgi:hypothetical protein